MIVLDVLNELIILQLNHPNNTILITPNVIRLNQNNHTEIIDSVKISKRNELIQ